MMLRPEHLSNCEPLHNLADRHNVQRFDSGVSLLSRRLFLTMIAAERFVAPVRVPRQETVCGEQRAVLYATREIQPLYLRKLIGHVLKRTIAKFDFFNRHGKYSITLMQLYSHCKKL